MTSERKPGGGKEGGDVAVRHYVKGYRIPLLNRPALYTVTEGLVGVAIPSSAVDRPPSMIVVVRPGETFGYENLGVDDPSLYAEAASLTGFASLKEEAIDIKKPDDVAKLGRSMAKREAVLNEMFLPFLGYARNKVAATILRTSLNNVMQLTQGTMAKIAGMDRATFTRNLQALRRKGWVKGRTIVDAEALRRASKS